jgi:galactokinase
MIAKAAFERAFGAAPDAVATTPGRVNLIGEHTDYNGGLVFPTAIERFTSVAIARNPAHDEDVIASATFEGVVRRSAASPRRGDWSDYAAGALDAARARGFCVGGAQVFIDSDVPAGAGLSSSAALIVAVLKAAAAATGAAIALTDIALLAQKVENDFIGVPCGIMDQMAVAHAAPGFAIALDTASLAFEKVALPADFHFAVVHSGVTRKLEDGRYAERRRECEQAAQMLGVPLLCRMDDATLARARAETSAEFRRAVHAATEHRRVIAAVAALKAGDIGCFGALMDESHASMRDDFDVSTPEIDRLVETARAEGAVGARLTGGGFGGCIVACVPRARLDGWRSAILGKHPAARFVC